MKDLNAASIEAAMSMIAEQQAAWNRSGGIEQSTSEWEWNEHEVSANSVRRNLMSGSRQANCEFSANRTS